ncbi:MAG: peptidase M15 [Nitrospirae bacterium]|nr:peptidase M15 [Nitrospirota bacterium]
MKEQTTSAAGQTPTASQNGASKYFKPEEFTCRCGCGLNNISPELVATLDKVRETAGIALRITSGSRCAKHNEAVGGKSDSAHLTGLAADIAIGGSHERYLVSKAAIAVGVDRMGIGMNLVHLDIDKDKSQQVTWLYA